MDAEDGIMVFVIAAIVLLWVWGVNHKQETDIGVSAFAMISAVALIIGFITLTVILVGETFRP